MSLDAEIDRLYQRPLDVFTGARNDLARRAGDEGARVRSLKKPSLAAWAVNQLYWHDRAQFDALVRAARRLRAAQVRAVSGTRVDLTTLERAHQQALSNALTAARARLDAGGHWPTPTVLAEVDETLLALPGEDLRPGRLVRALKPPGFGALVAMMPPGGQGPRRLEPRDKKGRATASREKRRRRHTRAETARALTRARQTERRAEFALAAARRELTGRERDLERLQAAVEKETFELRRLRSEVEDRHRAFLAAVAAREDVERNGPADE